MFIVGFIVGLFTAAILLAVVYAVCAASADIVETVDEWGKPDWVGKDVRR